MNCSLAFRMLLPAERNANINSETKHMFFVHELQAVLRLTVGFSNSYCEPLQIYHFCICHVQIKLKSNYQQLIYFSVSPCF
jgi:hypothetical protein